MLSPTQNPTSRASDPPPSEAERPQSPDISHLRHQVAGTMLSAVPLSQASTPKKPKLSLQTALPSFAPPHNRHLPLNIPMDSESPTARNTVANTFERPPPTPSSAIKPWLDISRGPATSPTSSASRAGYISPFSSDAPYALPIGAHSILRNSPLPRRHVLTTPSRPHKRLFVPTKRVHITERAAEVIPTPIFDSADEDCEEGALTTEEREERKAAIEAEDGHSSMAGKRSRRNREWISRPFPEESPRPGSDDELEIAADNQ
ncbi:MAG: hypothetical protein OHK93_003280 [Ramalina farinacea]|uniref:Uncharacterized protein n=1 Tax=Ramalina farinacea TaxID=258253 RepID=A0AA43QUR8_9LECA|nr:hypothetical protein [Ramalina farinacea]